MNKIIPRLLLTLTFLSMPLHAQSNEVTFDCVDPEFSSESAAHFDLIIDVTDGTMWGFPRFIAPGCSEKLEFADKNKKAKHAYECSITENFAQCNCENGIASTSMYLSRNTARLRINSINLVKTSDAKPQPTIRVYECRKVSKKAF